MQTALIDILIYGLFLILISINYFIFSFINSKFIIKDKVAIIPNVIEGLINGLIAVLIKLTLLLIFDIEFKYLILIISILIVVRNYIVYLGAIIPLLIMHWFLNGFGNYSYIFLVSLIVISFAIFLMVKKLWFNKLSLRVVYIPINFIAFFIMLIFSWIFWTVNIDWSFVSKFIMPLFFLSIVFAIYIYVLSFWKSAHSLIDVSIYDISNFYRIKTSREALGSFLFNNKPKNGIFIIWNFYNKQFNDGLYKEKTLLEIENQFNKFNALYFKISNDEYGMFFTIIENPDIKESLLGNSLDSRLKHDVLYEAQKTINNINKTLYKKMKFGAALYGIHESEFNLAFNRARFARNSSAITSKNIISLFDPVYYNKYIRDSLLMKKLNREIYTGHISTEFQSSITNKGNLSNIFYSRPYMPSSSIGVSVEQILAYSEERGDRDVLTRYLAAETVRNFGKAEMSRNKQIMFAYSASLIATKQFNSKMFVNIIKSHKVRASNIILMLNFSTIEKYYKRTELIKNIKKLRECGIQIAIKKMEFIEKKWELLKKVPHDYICIDQPFYLMRNALSPLNALISFANSLGSKIIAYQISNKKQLKKIIMHNVDIICGDYIQHASPNPIAISIYERKIIKEKIYG